MSKNKKAAFEMSITTIIVIVISVVMLIFGLIFVKTIMCGSIEIAKTTIAGAEDQIKKMFDQQGGEIVCMGAKNPLTIVPNKYNVVGCGFSPDINKAYKYSFTVESAFVFGTNQDIKNEVKNWIAETLSGTVNAGPGETSYATFGIQPPSDAQHIIVVIQPTVDGITKPKMRFEVTSIGWIRENVC